MGGDVGRRRGLPDRLDLLAAASTVRPGRDLDLALELRDNAFEQIAAVAASPVDLASQALLGPLMGVVSRQLRSFVGRAPKEPKEK